MARIRVKNGPLHGQTFSISEQPLVIGRDPGCSVSIQDKGASRRHAEFFRIGDMCFIRDLESRNGTFVNDNRITEEMLRDGDRIQVGGTMLGYEVQGGGYPGDDLEFSEEDVDNFYELRLEDLTAVNVGEGDMSSARHLRALYRLSRLAAGEESEAALINNILPFVVQTFRADGAYLFERDSQSGSIVTLGAHVPEGKKSGQLSRTIIRRVVQDRRALLTTDAMRDDRFSSRESVMRLNIHAVICAPLSFSGELQAVLYIAGDDPNIFFSEEELELAAAMADQAGMAISRLRTREKQREHMLSLVRTLIRVADATDPESRGHNEKVAAYMLAIGRAMRLKPDELEKLQLAALLHNCGKLVLRIPSRPGDIEHEKEIIQATLELLRHESIFNDLEDTVRHQLERYDGSGPERLKGGQIPVGARVFQVAHDLVVTMEGLDPGPEEQRLSQAVDLLLADSSAYDPAVLTALTLAHDDGTLLQSLDMQWRGERPTVNRELPDDG